MATADIVRRHYGGCGHGASEPTTLHCRARGATLELAALAQLRQGSHVLDVGSGLGGAARDLASMFGVTVTGLELTAELVARAREATARAGLASAISFEHGNILAAPFPSGTFDVVWLQHVLPNIADKTRLFAEVRRILAPGGCIALHEVVAFDGHRLRFPLPWATTPAASFLARPERLRHSLESAGFTMKSWRDTSRRALKWCRELAATLDVAESEALANLADSLAEGRLGIVMAVFEQSGWRPQRPLRRQVLPFTRTRSQSARRRR